MKSPKTSALTTTQQEELRTSLENLSGELRQAILASGESTRPVDLDQPIGRLSRMDAIQQQKMAIAGKQAMEARLRLVGAALSVMKRGEYGDCQDCEEPIGYPRLRAKPETRLCVGCQSAQEL